MPIHDWTRVDAGLFHAFRLRWVCALFDALNGGLLPSGYFALIARRTHGELSDDDTDLESLLSWPEGKTLREEIVYSRRADRITIQKSIGNIVAVIDIASTGNKTEFAEFRRFVEQAAGFVAAGVHLLVVDLYPSDEFPEGIPNAIWDEVSGEKKRWWYDKPMAVASIEAGAELKVYVEPLAVGDRLADMPLFLEENNPVLVPLAATYEDAWSKFPAVLRSQQDCE